VAVVLAYGWFYAKIADIKRDSLARINDKVEPLKQKQGELQVEHGKLKKLNQESDQLTEWMEQRFFWPDVLTELRRLLMQAETKLSGDIESVDETAVTFSFGVTLKLKHPMKL